MNPHRNQILMTHEEIARRLHISRPRVAQLERRALRKMRKGLERLGITSSTINGYDDDAGEKISGTRRTSQ
jgi:transcriptional regulator